MTTDDRTTESAMAVLAELDPAPPAHAGAHLSPRAGRLLQDILDSDRDGDDHTTVERAPDGGPTTTEGSDELRTRRRRRAWTVALVGAAAAVLAGALVVLPSLRAGDGDTEAAAWSAIPSAVPADDLADYAPQCGRGANGEAAGNPDGTRTVVAEQRGARVLVAITDRERFMQACMFDANAGTDDPEPFSGLYGSLRGPQSDGPLQSPFSMSGGTPDPDESASVFLALARDDVTAVILHATTGEDVTATVEDGFVIAWIPVFSVDGAFPDSEDEGPFGSGLEATLTYEDGSSERVSPFAPPSE